MKGTLDRAAEHAIERSGDFATAFLPKPFADIVFTKPAGREEVAECKVGAVWHALLSRVEAASWLSISQNLVGFLYETIVDPNFRHDLGQFYTREDVVDILVTFAVRQPGDIVLDPAAGGGSFLRSAYDRKTAMGEPHEDALSTIWGVELTGFAAELSTISLATADTTAPAAYPRVLLNDFFNTRPGMVTDLKIPGLAEPPKMPQEFDAGVGNPPYISYRRQTNLPQVAEALTDLPQDIRLPKFSGKSDAYVWFFVHATQFLKERGRLAFVVSSAVLFADYGIPLIRFLGRHYRIIAVVDSMVERWFPDADTNTVFLLLERCSDPAERSASAIRFVRLRRPLAQLLPPPGDENRRQSLEDLVETFLCAPAGGDDPRWMVNIVPQGENGGLILSLTEDADPAAMPDAEGEAEE